MTHYQTDYQDRYLIPGFAGLYASLGDFAFALLRFVAGAALITHGAGKIVDPLGSVEMVESLGFYPGIVFSPLLAGTEFFGGMFIAIGFLTRPAAFAAMFVLLVTVYFHWIVLDQGYMGAEKSIIWATVFFFFVVKGGGRYSVDRRLRREF